VTLLATGEATRFHLARWDWEPLRLPLSVMGALAVVAAFAFPVNHSFDVQGFWSVDLDQPYSRITSLTDFYAFRYAPPFVLLFAPLRLLPLEVVMVGWAVLQLVALWSINRRWFLALVLFPPVWVDLNAGNVNIFLAAMIVAGWRYPGAWVFGLLSKITPGVGIVWFAVRRDWRALAWIAGVTAGVVAASLLVQGPGIWGDWFASLQRMSTMPIAPGALPIPVVPRVIAAALLVAWGGLTDRQWTVPVAVSIAMPSLWVVAATPLVALARDRYGASVTQTT